MKDLSLALRQQYAIVIQTEVYTILRCLLEINQRTYRNRRIYILTDPDSTGALRSPNIKSTMMLECLNELTTRADNKRGIDGNERADELAREGSAKPFLRLDPALVIPTCIAREIIRGRSKWNTRCTGRRHQVTWKTIYRKTLHFSALHLVLKQRNFSA